MNKQRLAGLFCALAATMCWASNYPVSRLIFNNGIGNVDEWWSAWLRNFFCAFCLLPLTFTAKKDGWGKLISNWKSDLKIFIFLGVALVLESAMCFAAAKYTTAARTSLFANTSPVFTLLISFLFAKELLTGRKILGVLMGLTGVIIAAVSRGSDAFTANSLSTLGGDMLALISGVFWAIFTVFGGEASTRYNGIFCTVLYRVCGLLVLTPVLFFCDISFKLPLTVWLGLLYMAVVSGGFAVWLWSYAQKHVEPGVLGSFGYLSAFCATLFSMLFLKEKITLPFVAAFILILGGMVLILKTTGKNEKCFSSPFRKRVAPDKEQ